MAEPVEAMGTKDSKPEATSSQPVSTSNGSKSDLSATTSNVEKSAMSEEPKKEAVNNDVNASDVDAKSQPEQNVTENGKDVETSVEQQETNRERKLVEDMTDKLLKSVIADAADQIESDQHPPSLQKRFSISHYATDDTVIAQDDVDASGGLDVDKELHKERLVDEIDKTDYDLGDEVKKGTGKDEIGASGDVHEDVDLGDVTAAAMPDPSEILKALQAANSQFNGAMGAAAGYEPDPEETLDEEYYYSDDSDFDPPAESGPEKGKESVVATGEAAEVKSQPKVEKTESKQETKLPVKKLGTKTGETKKPDQKTKSTKEATSNSDKAKPQKSGQGVKGETKVSGKKAETKDKSKQEVPQQNKTEAKSKTAPKPENVPKAAKSGPSKQEPKPEPKPTEKEPPTPNEDTQNRINTALSTMQSLEARLAQTQKKSSASDLGEYNYLLSSRSNRSVGQYNELLKLQMDIGRIQRCMSEMQSQIRALAKTVDEMTERAEADIGE